MFASFGRALTGSFHYIINHHLKKRTSPRIATSKGGRERRLSLPGALSRGPHQLPHKMHARTKAFCFPLQCKSDLMTLEGFSCPGKGCTHSSGLLMCVLHARNGVQRKPLDAVCKGLELMPTPPPPAVPLTLEIMGSEHKELKFKLRRKRKPEKKRLVLS